MDIKESLNELMNKDLDRKEFLKHVGIGLLAILGVTQFLKSLTRSTGTTSTKRTHSQSGGYGGKINLKGR